MLGELVAGLRDYAAGKSLDLRAPLGLVEFGAQGAPLRQTRVRAQPTAADEPSLAARPGRRAGSIGSASMLQRALPSGRDTGVAAPGFLQRTPELLAQALAQAGVGAEARAPVLALLRDPALYDLPRLPLPAPRAAMALRVAQILSRSATAFGLLARLAHGALGGGDASRTRLMRLRLQAADQLAGQPGAAPDHPAHLAWQAAGAALARRALTPVQRAALFHWEQQVPQDRGLTLGRMQTELWHFRTSTLRRVGALDSALNGPARLAGRHHGPLRALAMGRPDAAARASRADAARADADTAMAVLQRDIRRLQDFQQAADAVMHSRELGLEAICASQDPPLALLRAAVLHHWLALGTPEELPVTGDTVDEIAIGAWHLCRPMPDDGAAGAGRLPLVQLRQLTDAWLHTPSLRLWHEAGFRRLLGQDWHAAALVRWTDPGRPVSPAFARAVERLGAAQPSPGSPLVTVREPRATVAAEAPAVVARPPSGESGRSPLHCALRELVRELPQAPKVRMACGRQYGLGTKQLSRALVSVAAVAGAPVSGEVDLSLVQGHERVVELSRGSEGITLFLGRQATQSQRAGVAAHVGGLVQTPGMVTRAGLRVELVPYQRVRHRPAGLVLRIARRLLPDGSDFDDPRLEARALALIDHLCASPPPDGPDGTGAAGAWQQLVDAFAGDPDFSVGWRSARSARTGASARAALGLTQRALQVAVGPEVALQAGVVWRERVRDRESGLRVSHDRTSQGGYTLSVEAAVALRYRASLGNGQVALLPEWQAGGALSMPPPSAGSATAAAAREPAVTTAGGGERAQIVASATQAELPLYTWVHDHQRRGRVRLVEDRGEVVAVASTFNLEFKSRDEWEREIVNGLDGWVESLALQQRLDCRRPDGRAGISLAAARTEARARLRQFLAGARVNERDFDQYQVRLRLREDVACEINAARAWLQGTDPARRETGRAAVQSYIDGLLRDRASWLEAELYVGQNAYAFRRSGLDFGVKLQRHLTLATEREWSKLKVSVGALRTRERRRGAAAAGRRPEPAIAAAAAAATPAGAGRT